MHERILRFALAALVACAAAAQPSARPATVSTFTLYYTDTAQEVEEMAGAVRAIADMPQAAPEADGRSLSLGGTADQIALAEWLLNQLDQPASPRHDSTAHDYTAAARDPAVRVFHFAHVTATLDYEEMVTAIHVVSNVPRFYPNWAQRAVVARGTAEDMERIQWMADELDQPPSGISSNGQSRDMTGHMYQAGAADDVTRLFRLAHAMDRSQMQDTLAQIRAATKLRLAVAIVSQKAFLIRGTAAQVGEAADVIQVMDQP